MSNYNDDDFFSKLIEDIGDLDDDDLFLLDVEDDEPYVPLVGGAAATTEVQQDAPRSRKQKKAPVALIVILIILILLTAGALVALKVTDGDISKLWTAQTVEEAEDTEAEEPEEEEQPEEAEVVEEDTESEEGEEVESEEEESEEDAATLVSFEGLALLELWGQDYTPSLVGVNNLGGAQADTSNGQLDSTAASYLEQFIAAARDAGFNTVCTASGKYKEAGDDATDEELEHATGLAVDLVDVDNQIPASFLDDTSMADELAWWAEHAAEYGFVLRYPADKEDITGVSYIPYHFVYVTTAVAQEMAENNWCLEEYLSYSGAASDGQEEAADSAETTETA